MTVTSEPASPAAPNSAHTAPLVMALDVGGTKIAAAVVDAGGIVVERFPDEPTPSFRGADELEAAVWRLLINSGYGETVTRLGVSMAGFVGSDSSTVVLAPNLGLRDYPMGQRLAERTGLPVTVENDVNAAAWGEYRFGAGKDAAVMVLVMIGTGLGGGIVVNGSLLRGEHGFAAEIGHLRHVAEGPSCGCGNRGCWEQFASSHAVRRYRESSHPTSEDEVFATLGGDLGLGIADLVMLLDPSVVVLGGGLAHAHTKFTPAMDEALRSRLGHTRNLPRIGVSTLGADAALRGIADLCLTLEASS